MMQFKSVISGELSKAMNAAAKACKAVKADAAAKGGLDNSRVAFLLADAIKSEGLTFVDRSLQLYSEAELLKARPRGELQATVHEAIVDFHQQTLRLGLQSEAFGGSRNAAFMSAHARILSQLQEQADRYFAGYGAPKPAHLSVRRPLVWLIVQTAVSTVVASVVAALIAFAIAG